MGQQQKTVRTVDIGGGQRKVVGEDVVPPGEGFDQRAQPALGGLKEAAAMPTGAAPDPMMQEEPDWMAMIHPALRPALTDVSRRSGLAGLPIQGQMMLEGLLQAQKARQ